MASSEHFSCFLIHSMLVLLVLDPANAQLKVGFYEKTCPNAESIVNGVMRQVMSVAPSLSGPLLRMHFHDCFVRGCDGSVLLNDTVNVPEKIAPPNLSLRGFTTIDRVKAALEKACPGVVSCSDILALVARDVVFLAGGPSYRVETGRKDGNASNALETRGNLPPPTSNFTNLRSAFQAKGLSVKDLVVLSGGHTLGTSHCSSFNARIYNFTGKGDTDPSIDPNYVKKLKMKCKPNDNTTLVEMDPGSVRTFDGKYFTLVAKRRGLFASDSALLDDRESRAYIFQAITEASSFFKDFGESMVKMGRIGVLTGNAGSVRKFCYKNN